jgi:hypothetical protein
MSEDGEEVGADVFGSTNPDLMGPLPEVEEAPLEQVTIDKELKDTLQEQKKKLENDRQGTAEEVGMDIFGETNPDLTAALPEVEEEDYEPRTNNMDEVQLDEQKAIVEKQKKVEESRPDTAEEVGMEIFGKNEALEVKLPEVEELKVRRQTANLTEISMEDTAAQIKKMAAENAEENKASNESATHPPLLADLNPDIKHDDIRALAHQTSAEFDKKMEAIKEPNKVNPTKQSTEIPSQMPAANVPTKVSSKLPTQVPTKGPIDHDEKVQKKAKEWKKAKKKKEKEKKKFLEYNPEYKDIKKDEEKQPCKCTIL